MSGIDGKAALAEMIENLGDLPEVRAIAAYVAELEAEKELLSCNLGEFRSWRDLLDVNGNFTGQKATVRKAQLPPLEIVDDCQNGE
jgi:hypothetical protein